MTVDVPREESLQPRARVQQALEAMRVVGLVPERLEVALDEWGAVGDARFAYWSYANLAMAHAAVTGKAPGYTQVHFMIRSRLYKGLHAGSMNIGPIADDERLKMILPQACCYCGSKRHLAADHLIPRKMGGADSGDNRVWACRSCNSSKSASDVLGWLARREQFPPLLLLRRYLKPAVEISRERQALLSPISELPQLPFSIPHIPTTFPAPGSLKLWTTELPL
jgi:hypothetical protein